MPLLQVILLSALPALGFLILAIVIGRWGKKRDTMGGRPGQIWTSGEPPVRRTKGLRRQSKRSPAHGTERTSKTPQ